MNDRLKGPQNKVYENGESFLYLGETYPIEIVQDKNLAQDSVVFDKEKLIIYVKQHDAEK